MKETATQINKRKIRNGLRKQREVIEREQQKVWDRLKDTTPGTVKRALRGNWTVEAAQDLNSMFGMDLEEELAKTLIAEIAAEQAKNE